MLPVKRDSAIAEPLHRQVRNSIEELIRSGNGNDAISLSDADLCERFQVSRITVRRAVKELVDAGLLYRMRGVGTFVRPRKTKEKLTLTSFLDAWAGKPERLRASPSASALPLAPTSSTSADYAMKRKRWSSWTTVICLPRIAESSSGET
jgi:DNA-binding transcriptional regulator YhcF (GntR family)